jgi:hypothetical protein
MTTPPTPTCSDSLLSYMVRHDAIPASTPTWLKHELLLSLGEAALAIMKDMVCYDNDAKDERKLERALAVNKHHREMLRA